MVGFSLVKTQTKPIQVMSSQLNSNELISLYVYCGVVPSKPNHSALCFDFHYCSVFNSNECIFSPFVIDFSPLLTYSRFCVIIFNDPNDCMVTKSQKSGDLIVVYVYGTSVRWDFVNEPCVCNFQIIMKIGCGMSLTFSSYTQYLCAICIQYTFIYAPFCFRMQSKLK